ncbi:MAG: NDP-sugar synthase [Candidatus Bathyarchaeia archaeon]
MGDIKGVIMAGGEGKRFRPLTYYFQKCMIPVGERQKPILEYIVRLFKHHKISDIVLLVGYKHEQIVNYFNNGTRFGVNLVYLEDPPDLKGSANAILNAYKTGVISSDDRLVVYYGDIVSNIDLEGLLRQHEDEGADATVALARGFKIRVGTANLEGRRIVDFIEKPIYDKPVSIGVLVLEGRALETLRELQAEGDFRLFDLMGDVVPYLVRHNYLVNAYLTDAFWYDVGSIERYERLDNDELNQEMGHIMKTSNLRGISP